MDECHLYPPPSPTYSPRGGDSRPTGIEYYSLHWGMNGLTSVVDNEPRLVGGLSTTCRTFKFGAATPSFRRHEFVHWEEHIRAHHAANARAFKRRFRRDVEDALNSEGEKSFSYTGSHIGVGSHEMIAGAFEECGRWSLSKLVQMFPQQEEGSIPVALEAYTFDSTDGDGARLRVSLSEMDLNAVLKRSDPDLPIDQVKNGTVFCSLKA